MTEFSSTIATSIEDAGSVVVNIGDGPVTPDFDGKSRGWAARLILDPEDRTVTLHATVGGGIPASVWHGRACALSIPADAAGESVRSILESEVAQEHLRAIFAAYAGAEWDGGNKVGVWNREDPEDPKSRGAHIRNLEELEALLEEVHRYQDAASWIGGETATVCAEARAAVAGLKGEAAEAALRTLACGIAAEAETSGTILDVGEVQDFLASLLEEEDRLPLG